MRIGLSTVTGKIVASAAVLGTAATVAGLGTFGTFTATTTASQAVSTGTTTITLGTAGTSANRLNIGASAVVPGDTIERAVDLTNNGSQNLASIALTTVATATSLLDTSLTMGLQMTIDKCSTAWSETSIGAGYTYTCGGTTTSVVASTPVILSANVLTGLNALTAAGTDHLRVKLTLPVGADNTLQGKTSTIQYTFTGTQRLATTL
jgi:spore coat-associated protein N